MASTKKEMVAQEAEWKAESDLRTIVEAEKIKRDSKRLKAALTKGREQREALSKVVDQGKEKA